MHEHGKEGGVRIADVGTLQLQETSPYQRVAAHGRFHTAIDTVSGKTYLAEVFRFGKLREDRSTFTVIEENLAIGMSIDHPSIVKCYGRIDSPTTRTVLWQNFNISNISLKQIGDLHTQQVCILDLLTACAVLEAHGCYEICQSSVVVVDDPSPTRSVKLMVLPGQPVLDLGGRVCASLDGMPPELARSEKVGVGTTLWGAGVVAFRMLTKSVPFGDGVRPPKKLQHILNCSFDVRKLNSFSPLAADFFASIFKPRKEDRASADVLMHHPWFDETINSEEKAQILCSDVLRELISPGLLPPDIVNHLTSHIPYVERWALRTSVERPPSG